MNEHTKILKDEILAPLAEDNKVSKFLKRHYQTIVVVIPHVSFKDF